jgi:peptide/nickel transport system permease protein
MTVEDAGARPLAGRLTTGSQPRRGRALAVRIAARLGKAAVTLVGVAVLVFVVLRILPGNQITASLGVNAGLLTKAQYADLAHFYGIGKPLPQQFTQWAGALLHGDMGVSDQSGRTVTSLIGAALPVTLELALAAMLIGLVVGIGAGAIAAAAPGKPADRAARLVALAGLGVPSFVIGSGLVAVLASVFHYFPSSAGFVSLAANPWLNFQQILWPALTLGLGIGAAILRTTRGAMLDVARQGFVRAARGRGLRPRLVIVKHVLRNAMIPILTLIGLSVGYVFSGALITEALFNYPGMGYIFWNAALTQDYPIILGVIVVTGFATVLGSLMADIMYAIADPRVRYRRA